MISRSTLELPRRAVRPEALGPFRWGKIGEKVLLTSDAGEWQLLSQPDFARFLRGEITPEHPAYDGLRERGFLRQDLDAEDLARKLRRKRRYLGAGPHLAVVITTLRCQAA